MKHRSIEREPSRPSHTTTQHGPSTSPGRSCSQRHAGLTGMLLRGSAAQWALVCTAVAAARLERLRRPGCGAQDNPWKAARGAPEPDGVQLGRGAEDGTRSPRSRLPSCVQGLRLAQLVLGSDRIRGSARAARRSRPGLFRARSSEFEALAARSAALSISSRLATWCSVGRGAHTNVDFIRRIDGSAPSWAGLWQERVRLNEAWPKSGNRWRGPRRPWPCGPVPTEPPAPSRSR